MLAVEGKKEGRSRGARAGHRKEFLSMQVREKDEENKEYSKQRI